MSEIAVRIAEPFEAPNIVDVLREAATWLEQRGAGGLTRVAADKALAYAQPTQVNAWSLGDWLH